MLDELSTTTDEAKEGLIAYVRAALVSLEGDYTGAIASLEKALDVFKQIGEREGENVTYGMLAVIYNHTSQFAEGYGMLNRALDLATERNDESRVAWCRLTLAHVFHNVHEHERALEYLEKAEETYRRTDDGIGIVNTLYAKSMNLSQLGRHDEAIRYAEEAAAHPMSDMNPTQGVYLQVNLAYIYGNCKRYEDVERALARIDGSKISEFRTSVTFRAMKTWQTYRQGKGEEALAELTALLEEVDRVGIPDLAVTLHEVLRDYARLDGDFEAYVKHNDAVQEINKTIRGAATSQMMAINEVEKELAAERATSERQRALLYGTLPQEIADRMMSGEDVSGDHHENAAVLFLDVVGFTTHTSKMEPQQTTRLLAEIFERFDKICAEHGVTKIKTIGDSYMAVGFSDRRTFNRVGCSRHDQHNVELKWPDNTPIEFRIGLHAGPVVAGVIGTERLQYDVWGDTVNTASRMESTGEAGKVQVSSEFRDLLSSLAVVDLSNGGTRNS